MEIELERKLILLENSVRDLDERLAELYRETAGLAIQKSAILQDLGRNVSATKKHADEAKRVRSELKTDLVNVSEKLAKMDAVIAQLNAMRKAARTEKAKDVADLAASVLAVNRRVSKLAQAVETLRPSADPRVDALYSELQSLKDGMKKGGAPQLGSLVSRLDALEGELRSKVAVEELERNVSEIKAAIAKLGEKAVLPSDVDALRKDFLKSLDELDAKLKRGLNEKIEEHRKSLENKLGEKTGEIAGMSRMHDDIAKSVSTLEKQLKSLQGSVAALSGMKPAELPKIDFSRVESVEKRVETVRERANSILKEIYDMIDSLREANAGIINRLSETERRLEAMPRVTAEGNVDLSGVLSSIDELRENVSTLAKGIDISKVIAEELKKTQEGLGKLEDWKNRREEMPRELERLAERIAALEALKPAAASDIDINNLKLAVAELANKNRLINELALENQKLHNKIFVLEEKLDASIKKLPEKEN
ncbi:MAG: hypothetical protein QXD77_00355 [Candidatus Aenigmatarchaeota archaeon]